MKKIICIVLCLFMVAAVFAGCVEKKTMTFKEAAEAGKEFIKNDAFKDVKYVTEADGTKLILEGKYDPKNEKAVFSVSVDTKDTTQTFKDMIKSDGKKLYIKVPDIAGTGLDGIFSSALPFKTEAEPDITDVLDSMLISEMSVNSEEIDDDEDGDYITGDYGFDISMPATVGLGLTDEIAGKYIVINLPENKPETMKSIMSDAEDNVYEKAEKLEAEEDYPYVVKYTQKSAYDLIISVLDGIKAKKSELAAEFAALISEYLGEEDFKTLEEVSGKTAADMISEGIDEFFKEISPDDIAPENAENFEVIQKIAYDTDKKLEYVFLYDLKDKENTHSVKTTLTVTAAEDDASFAEKCAVQEDEIFDMAGYIKNMLNTLKALSNLKSLFN